VKREPIFGMQRGAAGPTARTTIESSFVQDDIGVTVAGLTWSGGVIGAAQTLDLIAADGTFAGKYYVEAVDTGAHTVSLSLLVTATIGLGQSVPAGCYALSSGSPGADGANGLSAARGLISMHVTAAQFTAASSRQTFTFADPLPAGARIDYVNVLLDQSCGGGGAGFVGAVLGRTGELGAYLASIDLGSAPVDGCAPSTSESPSIHRKITVETFPKCEISSDANINTLTDGDFTIEILYTMDPA